MASIEIFDGKSNITIDVSADFHAKFVELEHKEQLIERKETRRHQSLNKSLDNGWDVVDKSIDVFEDFIKKEEARSLHKAIEKLQPQQQELVRRVYFNDEKMTVIALEWDVDSSSIRHRMARALKMLKKYLE